MTRTLEEIPSWCANGKNPKYFVWSEVSKFVTATYSDRAMAAKDAARKGGFVCRMDELPRFLALEDQQKSAFEV